MSPRALAELHLEVLYELDEDGRLLRARGAHIAVPDFHLVRTVEVNQWGVSAALEGDDRARRLEEALRQEPVIRSTERMEDDPPLLAGETTKTNAYRGPAFVFPDSLPPMNGSAELLDDCRGATALPELSWIREATPTERPLSVARNLSGEIVSVCHSARASASGAEAGVETAPGYRGRGLAGAVVLAWAAALLVEGRLPLYSTQWTNQASRAVARKLGLIPYGEDYHCP